jgi:hypothetical protein
MAGRPGRHATGKPTSLRCPADHLTFGTVWESDKFAWTLPIKNHDDQDLHITGFANTCTCVSITPRALTVPAGETREVRVELDLRAGKDARFDLSPFPFVAEVVPLVGIDQVAGARWELRGEVRPAVRVEKVLLEFGQRSERAKTWEPKRVKVIVADGFTVAAISPHSCFGARLEPPGKEPGRYDLVVVPRGVTPIDSYSFDVLLTPKSSAGEELTPQRLAVRASVVGDVQASVRQVLFGARSVGEQAEETLTLSSLTGQAFELTNVEASLRGLHVKAASDSSATERLYHFQLTALVVGEQRGEVTFQYRLADGHSAKLTLPVMYLGRSGP